MFKTSLYNSLKHSCVMPLGSSGKTQKLSGLTLTSTFNIGAGLHKLGKKVLLIDLDPQASLTTSAGIKQPESSMYDYLKNKKK